MKFKFEQQETKISTFVEDWRQLGPEGETLWLPIDLSIELPKNEHGYGYEVYTEHGTCGYYPSIKAAKEDIKAMVLADINKGGDDWLIKLPFDNNSFKTIECDFPWRYDDHGLNGFKGSKRWRNHTNYLCCPIEVLRNTCHEITRIAGQDAHLYFWTTDAFLRDSLNMLEAAGWVMKQDLIWVKTSKGTPDSALMLPGHYFRRNVEHCLFCIRKDCKKPIQPKQHASLRGTFFWRKPPQHSAKPDEFYTMMVDNSPGPRVSLFQRTSRPGFTCWGNEMEECGNCSSDLKEPPL